MVAACGYKGPLYMPTPDGKPPPRTQSQSAPQVPQIPAAPSLP
ncbi:LPS translocon maturation chaperone LptM [Achromobacter sp. NCFB-sbj8-Ac1-l]